VFVRFSLRRLGWNMCFGKVELGLRLVILQLLHDFDGEQNVGELREFVMSSGST
jgi:hypothetical protein